MGKSLVRGIVIRGSEGVHGLPQTDWNRALEGEKSESQTQSERASKFSGYKNSIRRGFGYKNDNYFLVCKKKAPVDFDDELIIGDFR